MTPAEKQQLDGIIQSLETVQAQAPVKTTYTMGKADHSMSHALMAIIRDLKAFTHDTVSEPEPGQAAGTGSLTLSPDTAKAIGEATRKASK